MPRTLCLTYRFRVFCSVPSLPGLGIIPDPRCVGHGGHRIVTVSSNQLRVRKERDPEFIERRTFWSKGYRICVGAASNRRCLTFSQREFEALSASIRDQGFACVDQIGGERLWWLGREELYWADDELSGEDVALLVWDRHRRQEGKLDRLRKIRAREIQAAGARRERIPEDVRNFVWQRDEGRCVACGAEEELQFDHVIPVARGGSNAAENIQILCGPCNRAKGAAIG